MSRLILSWFVLTQLLAGLASYVESNAESTTEFKWKATKPALSDEMIEALRDEGRLYNSLPSENLRFGKKATVWYPTDESGNFPPPKFLTERAIHLLRDLDFPGDEFAKQGIVGAEWWYQVRSEKEGIGFHYDKDEGWASEHMQLRFPSHGTITYLTDSGSPTLVLNQHCEDGNNNIPIIPEEGALFFPEKNKHVVFKGNFMHGVVGDLGHQNPKINAGKDTRVTFLVNWWKKTPIPPNCKPLSEKHEEMFITTTSSLANLPGVTNSDNQNLDEITFGDNMIKTKILLPPSEPLYLSFPPYTAPNIHLNWTGKAQALGAVGELDLQDRNVMGFIWSTPLPKLFLFHLPRQKESTVTVAMNAVRPYVEKFRAYTADSQTTADAMQAFGLNPRLLPTAVIHDTANNRKYRMEASAILNVGTVTTFIEDFLAGKLQTMRERSEL